MPFAAVLSLFGCLFAIYVAALSLRFSRAAGWEDQRWFGLVALTAAAFSAADLRITFGAGDEVVRFDSQLQLLFGTLHIAAWISYATAFVRRKPGTIGRALQIALVVLGLSVFIPGAVYPGPVCSHTIDLLQMTYREPVITAYGGFVLAALVFGFLGLVVFFGLAWRRGVRSAGTHCCALLWVLPMAVNDALTLEGVISSPYFIDIAFTLPTMAMAYSITWRFAEDARALADLRLHLEAQVEARTRQLGQAQAALARAENLAALGQIAGGVAHKVNNPLTVVSASLDYLSRTVTRGEAAAEMLESIADAKDSTQRVAQIVRQLADAGKLATARPAMESVEVAGAVQEAVGFARKRCGAHVKIQSEVRAGICVLAQESMLVQLLLHLITNAGQAIPDGRDGLVRIGADQEGNRVRLTVGDNGTGMSAEVQRRAFEPFFGTKPGGAGAGLGLTVARSIVESLDGKVRLESTEGEGTRAIVELPAAAGSAASG
jgi:signal transduction histidine kinase